MESWIWQGTDKEAFSFIKDRKNGGDKFRATELGTHGGSLWNIFDKAIGNDLKFTA